MDRVLPIFKKLGITPSDSWTTLHILPGGKKDTCYYHTFKIKKMEYCVSADSISVCFSSLKGMIYIGYDLNKLEKEIKKVIEK